MAGGAFEIVLTDAPDPAARDVIVGGIVAFNTARMGPSGSRPLAVLLRQPDGSVAGGLWGRTSYGWLYVELLFVPEEARGTGLGRALMGRAEAEALERGCIGVWIDTFGEANAAFYGRLGYTRFGAIEDHPPGSTHIFLKKVLPGE